MLKCKKNLKKKNKLLAKNKFKRYKLTTFVIQRYTVNNQT